MSTLGLTIFSMAVSKIVILIAVSLLLSCGGKKETDPVILSQIGYFKAVAKNDVELAPAKEGEWLYSHKEPGQTFEQYKKQNRVRPTTDRSIIYLLPVGDFTALQSKMLNLTRDYVEIFFQQKTVLLNPVSDKTAPDSVFRQREENNIQLLAPYMLNSFLKGRLPKDGIALMAISAKDLYPKNDWNYVFGLASYGERVGVSSIYRLENTRLTEYNFGLCLKRLTNVTCYEIGHMFTFRHCTCAKCTMNGSDGLSELDQIPNRLCSECQKKLLWNHRYSSQDRLKQLGEFFKQNHLQNDYELLKADLDRVD